MAEKYRPLFKLDAGGMAEVYVAEAESMAGFKKKVAIKRILPGLLKDDRFVRMFLDEARLSLHLQHANVVSVFDIGKSNDTYFIVMEYVEGTTLKKILEWSVQRRRRLPVHVAVWMINQILDGLGYAHDVEDPENPGKKLGIVHRDISPPNILVSWKGEVKLTDFGLAKATTQLESTDPGVVKGKFAYLSPEAAHGNEVDARTDIFAVGILAYEMLTGKRLFLGDTDWQTVEKVRACEIPSISAQNPDVPKALEDVVFKALAKDVNDRYQTAAEFADEIIGVLFQMGKRVSAREAAHLLEELRDENKPPTESSQNSMSGGIIADLIAEEMMNFRSIDKDESPGATPLASLGAAALVDFGDDEIDTLGLSTATGTGVASLTEPDAPSPRSGIPGEVDSAPTGVVQSPSPKRERGGGGIVAAVVLVLLVLGGSAAYYFLVMQA